MKINMTVTKTIIIGVIATLFAVAIMLIISGRVPLEALKVGDLTHIKGFKAPFFLESDLSPTGYFPYLL